MSEIGRVDLIYSLKGGGKNKTRRLTYINPALDDNALAEVAAALAGLSENDLYEAYRVEKADLSMGEPELSIDKNYIDVPDTITASWSGGGILSVSLQNDIANYAISGSKIIFSQKPNYATGIYSTDGLISVGENENYDSDSVTFSATAYYLPSPDLRLSSYHVTFGGLMANSTNVAARWKGNGVLSIVNETSDYYTYEIQNAAYDATADISTANIIFTKNATPTDNYFGAPVIHIANTNSFAPQNFIFTVACATNFETLKTSTISANTDIADEFVYVLDDSDINDRIYNTERCNYLDYKTGDDYLESYGDFCTLSGGAGNNTIYSEGKCCYVRDYFTNLTINDSIESYGDFCTIYTSNGDHTIYSEGKSCSINAYRAGNHKIESEGDFCTIISRGGSDTAYVYGKECYCSVYGDHNQVTIEGNNSTLHCRGTADVKLDGNSIYFQHTLGSGDSIHSYGNYCTIQGGSGNDTIWDEGDFSSINAGGGTQNSVRINGSYADISIRGGTLLLNEWYNSATLGISGVQVSVNEDYCTLCPDGGSHTITGNGWSDRGETTLDLSLAKNSSIEVYNPPYMTFFINSTDTIKESINGSDRFVTISGSARRRVTLYSYRDGEEINYVRSA